MPGSYLKSEARLLIMKNSPKVFIISILYVVLITIISEFAFLLMNFISADELYARLLSGEIPNWTMMFTRFSPPGIALALLLNLLIPILDTGFMSYCMKLSRKSDTEYKDLFNGLLFFKKVLLIFIITFILVFLWSFLFIFPGIVASYRYRQAYYILIDDPTKTALQCLAESAHLMHGKKMDLFILDLSFLGWHILNLILIAITPLAFAFPILSIWISPYIGLTRVGFYEDRIKTVAV